MNALPARLDTLPPEARDAQIATLCDRAIADLHEVRTIGEVRRIGAIAEALAAYTRKIRAAISAQNHAQLVVLLAEQRIGAELEAAQQRGELAKRGRPKNVGAGDIFPATLTDLGLTRDRAAEAKRLAELGEEVINEAARAATEAGERLTRSYVFNHRAQGTGNIEWFTPSRWTDAARAVMGSIDLDPASCEIANRTVRASRYFSADDDGLTREWAGRVWLNPPYSRDLIQKFAEKLLAEIAAGRVSEAVALTHAYTDTTWFHLLAERAAAICFTRGRISFLRPDGKPAATPTQGQTFFYFGSNVARFAEIFGEHGLVLRRFARASAEAS
jgi:ParB family chromosome partitioning protein